MIPNYAYVLEKCAALSPAAKILDYGCGGGHVIEEGRLRGLDIIGVEAFYAGSRAKFLALEKGLLGSLIFEIGANNALPLEDKSVSLVISNQVFEHVQDLNQALAEIFRVLRPGGALVALFPTREVWREGHCGIPFVHWFGKASRIRSPYMRVMRALGLGYFKSGKPIAEWSDEFLDWLDLYTVYRNYADIRRSFLNCGFVLEHMEDDYIGFRLRYRGSGRLAVIAKWPLLRSAIRFACRRLAGVVLLARKPPLASATFSKAAARCAA